MNNVSVCVNNYKHATVKIFEVMSGKFNVVGICFSVNIHKSEGWIV